MKTRLPIFIDDEPLVIEMMMTLLQGNLNIEIPFRTFSDPDAVADLIEQQQITSDHIIVVDRYLFQRDTLDMNLPKLFRDLGFKGILIIFSYIPVLAAQYGYDAYLKKDLHAVDAFTKFLLP